MLMMRIPARDNPPALTLKFFQINPNSASPALSSEGFGCLKTLRSFKFCQLLC